MSPFPDNTWLLRLDRACIKPFQTWLGDDLLALGDEVGEEFRLVQLVPGANSATLAASGLVRFALPVMLRLPSPSLAELVPSALDALADLAASQGAQAAACFPLRRHGRFAASAVTTWLATHLPTPTAMRQPSLIAAASDEVTFVGVTTLLATGATRLGGWPSSDSEASAPSRAGGKLEEALAWLESQEIRVQGGGTWLELGAFPGGMTTALAKRGFTVDAVDVAPPNAAMRALPRVTCHVADGSTFSPPNPVDALLCDMNGSPGVAARAAARAAASVKPGGLIVHTIKLPSWDNYPEVRRGVEEMLSAARVRVLGVKHLAANRQEVTLLGVKL